MPITIMYVSFILCSSFFVILKVTMLSVVYTLLHLHCYAECNYAEGRLCCVAIIIILNVIMLSVFMPSIIMLSVIVLSIIVLSVIVTSVIVLSVIMQSAILLTVAFFNLLNVIMLRMVYAL
jgi:hypothetical protein